MTPESPGLEVELKPEYEKVHYFLILPLLSAADPKVRKTDPGRLAADEVCLKLEVWVPKRRTRVAQTIVVKMPEEYTHLAQMEVIVADGKPPADAPG